MCKVIFIRHGATAGNLEKRYIGRTDESIISTTDKSYPDADVIYVSPMKRFIETAELIYPDRSYIIVDDLRECDFGKFEGKNYIDLNGDSDYQAWIDSNGTLPFPGGEAHDGFKKRCIEAFKSVELQNTNAFIVHGGTIMAILEHYSDPPSTFYDWHIGNFEGFETVTVYENKKLRVVNKL